MGHGTKQKDINSKERAKLALSLRKQGYTLEEIAQKCGYADKSGAWRAIKREIDLIPFDDVKELRKIEEMRLDEMLKVCYAKALEGNLWAVDRVVAISKRRSELIGIDVKHDDIPPGITIVRQYDVEVGRV